MKKIWPIVLISIFLLLSACTKQDEVVETDLIFEGKTYVVGSNKPPKGQPKKMLIQKREYQLANAPFVTVDSFYTNKDGTFSYRFTPNSGPSSYMVAPEPKWKYDNIDVLFPKRLGRHYQDFRILSIGILRLRLKNGNFSLGDSLVVIDEFMQHMIFDMPVAQDNTFDFMYPSFEELNFEFRLKRNSVHTTWKESYVVHDDSTHYHEVIY